MSVAVPGLGDTDPLRVTSAIRQLAEGRSNAIGSVTLTANAGSTVVTAVNCGSGSYPFLIPTTANAAAEIGNGTLYVGTVANQSFTITHANNGQTDRTFGYVCLG